MSRNRNNAKYEFRQGKTRRKFAVKTESNNAPLKNALRTEKMGFFDRKVSWFVYSICILILRTR